MPTSGARDQAIRERAYAIWEANGRSHGHDWVDWFRAESEIEYGLSGEIRDALFISNRAFVFPQKIDSIPAQRDDDLVTSWSFMLYWENGGNTPTRYLTNYVSYGMTKEPIDLAFEFPDGGHGLPDYSVIGPKGVRAAQIVVPVDDLKKVKNGDAHAYLWGWANYNDIFPGTTRHRTEFCVEIKVLDDPEIDKCRFSFQRHARYNGMDDECLYEPNDTGIRKYYKFLDSGDIEKIIIDGTLKVSSFEHFRELEEAQWGEIADPLEAASELTVRGQFVIRENSPELDMINKANIGLGSFSKFAHVSGGGTIDLSGGRFIHTVENLFIFSFSIGELNKLTMEMCVNARRPYDACVNIVDLAGLRRRIFEAGRVRDLDCKVSDVFEPGWIQIVEYEPRSRDIREGGVIEPTPFKKEVKFKPQSEVRLLLIPKETSSINKETLILEVPELGAHFKEVFRHYQL
jgi:hypothetical protein